MWEVQSTSSDECSCDVKGECGGDGEIFLQTEMTVSHYNIVWTFKNFSYFKKNPGETMSLPSFYTGKDSKIGWYLEMYPHGNKKDNDKYVSVFLKPVKDDRITARVEFSILNEEGVKANKFLVDIRQFSSRTGWGFERFIEREYLLNEENGFLINDVLTLYLELDIAEGLTTSNGRNTGSNVQEFSLVEDFKKLYENQRFADLTIKVGSNEYRVHKAILAARSAVFSAMYEHDMVEKNSNTLEIKDIEPKVMEEVLKYIYFGECNVKGMASEILPASDKYNLCGLKDLCEEAVREQLSINNAPLTLILADLHNLKELKKKTLEYICNNAKAVFATCYWKSLADSHPHLEFEAYKFIVSKTILLETVA